jgi:hypothetical protein
MRVKLIEYHLSRLEEKAVETRLDAIQQLVHLEAVEVLDMLKQIYETDSDPKVKRSAQLAGRELFLLQLKQEGTS